MNLRANGRYSVCQFLMDGTEEWVRRDVDAQEAARAANHYTGNVAAKFGITRRVVITDENGNVCYKWTPEKGGVMFL